jgi:hypothetical protein
MLKHKKKTSRHHHKQPTVPERILEEIDNEDGKIGPESGSNNSSQNQDSSINPVNNSLRVPHGHINSSTGQQNNVTDPVHLANQK